MNDAGRLLAGRDVEIYRSQLIDESLLMATLLPA